MRVGLSLALVAALAAAPASLTQGTGGGCVVVSFPDGTVYLNPEGCVKNTPGVPDASPPYSCWVTAPASSCVFRCDSENWVNVAAWGPVDPNNPLRRLGEAAGAASCGDAFPHCSAPEEDGLCGAYRATLRASLGGVCTLTRGQDARCWSSDR